MSEIYRIPAFAGMTYGKTVGLFTVTSGMGFGVLPGLPDSGTLNVNGSVLFL